MIVVARVTKSFHFRCPPFGASTVCHGYTTTRWQEGEEVEAWPQIGLTPSPTTTIPFFPIEYVGTFTIHKQLLLRKKGGCRMSHRKTEGTTGGTSVPFHFWKKIKYKYTSNNYSWNNVLISSSNEVEVDLIKPILKSANINGWDIKMGWPVLFSQLGIQVKIWKCSELLEALIVGKKSECW